MNVSLKCKKFSAIVGFLKKIYYEPKKQEIEKRNFVKIKIFDLPTIGLGCNPITCGPGYASVQMMVNELKSNLQKLYPGRTSTEYVNLLWVPQEKESKFGQLLVTKKLPSPIVVIEEEVKCAGSINIEVIASEVGRMLM
jgi:hypothetical protein